MRQEPEGPLEKLVTAILIAAVKVMQLVAERDGQTRRPLTDVFDPDDQPALERVCQSLEGKTQRQKNPHPTASLAYAAWVFARLGGWTGYYGKPGPIVMLRGLTQFHAIKHGWTLRDVYRVAQRERGAQAQRDGEGFRPHRFKLQFAAVRSSAAPARRGRNPSPSRCASRAGPSLSLWERYFTSASRRTA